MIWITNAKYMWEYTIWLQFNDGSEKMVDLKEKIFSDHRPVFQSLQNLENFRQVYFNEESDTIEWANGADLAPETLYKMPAISSEAAIKPKL